MENPFDFRVVIRIMNSEMYFVGFCFGQSLPYIMAF